MTLRLLRFLAKDPDFRQIVKCIGITIFNSDMYALILVWVFSRAILAILGSNIFEEEKDFSSLS